MASLPCAYELWRPRCSICLLLMDRLFRKQGISPGPADSTTLQLQKVVLCDVCDASTAETGHGVLQAHWRDGEAEGMRLCKSCFGYAMATLKREHWVNHMFDDDEPEQEGRE